MIEGLRFYVRCGSLVKVSKVTGVLSNRYELDDRREKLQRGRSIAFL